MSLDITLSKMVMTDVASFNITHNLNEMADAAGLYEVLWRSEEHGITTAAQLIEPLQKGIAQLRADPKDFKAFNPSNGWGTYEGFLETLERLLYSCQEHPDAQISTWR